MEIAYSRDACHSYLIISDVSNEEKDVEEKMLANQHSNVLLPFHMQLENNKKYYYYDITGKLEMKKYLERYQADINMINAMIALILQIYQTINVYLLGIDSILLDAAYLYVNVDEMQLYAVYIPGYDSNFKEDLKHLAAMLLENADHKDQEGILGVYDFYKTVQREDYNPALLKKLLKKKNKRENSKSENDVNNIEIENPSVDFLSEAHDEGDQLEDIDTESSEKKKKYITFRQVLGIGVCIGILLFYKTGFVRTLCDIAGWQINDKYVAFIILAVILSGIRLAELFSTKKKDGFAGADTEEDVWEGIQYENQGIYSFSNGSESEAFVYEDNQTMILSGMKKNIRLISLNRNIAPDLVLMDFPCVVGSLASDAHVVIEAVGISRKHACFEMIDENLYISDLQSTNGTYINGERLKKNEKRKLIIEDVIELADIRYMYGGSGGL